MFYRNFQQFELATIAERPITRLRKLCKTNTASSRIEYFATFFCDKIGQNIPKKSLADSDTDKVY